ncbi:hypothetical protein [Streptomyces sp. NBC_01190]|uniref:hypothetical protein n=1 Tax=Streptomyces sp. NBC_01190 TaxID=2903767 RepID=UPI00386C0B58|nr:hypothetical protein OG519_15695 [Streptomyces sp. NBC_01190]
MVTHVWKELDAEVAGRLGAVSEGERAVFATGVAQRLIQAHEAQPTADQRVFTLSLRPLLEAVWSAALGDATAFGTIKQGLGAFYVSDYCHNDGRHGPDDADEPAAAAVLHAAHAYMHGCADFAVFASGRAVEVVDELAQEADDFAADPDELRAEELRRQLRDLDLITPHATALRRARFGLPPATSTQLRTALRPPLSLPDDLN